MPVLNNINPQELCDVNQAFLAERELVDHRGYINLLEQNLEEQKNIVDELIRNEVYNAKASEENFKKVKHKSSHIILLLISALALIVAGFVLAPFFIASSMIMPIVPILLFGVAIIAITKFFLDLKSNRLGTEAKHAANVLEQLKKYERVNGNGEEITNALNNQIQEIKNITMNVYEKIGELKQHTTQSFSQLMQQTGLFSSAIPIPQVDPANEFHTKEAMSSSPTYN